MLRVIAVVAFICGFSLQAQAESFDQFLYRLEQQAVQKGFSQSFVSKQFEGMTPYQRAIELDRSQSGAAKRPSWPEYRDRVITRARIEEGRRLLNENRTLLTRVSNKYGVQPQYIVALWGLETSYGKNTGGFDVVQALATLAWEGRRRQFFTDELWNALRILQEGHIDRAHFKGSWAGAMGQNQFMPSSFFRFAVDETGDGRADIWQTRADIFASTANYLSKSGWVKNHRWGREVRLTRQIPSNFVGLDVKRPLSFWADYGVIAANNSPLPIENIEASIIIPDGLDGKVFLVYDNYRIIMTWNKSTNFALSVGHLADLIAQGN